MEPRVTPLLETLDQLAAVVGSLASRQYAEPPAPFSDSSVGAHVRHCLDHVEAFLAAAATGILDYDHRRRGTRAEIDPQAALEMILSQQARLRTLPAGAMEQPLTLTAMLSPHDPPLEVTTTLGRELAYVLSHTTHHNAIIGFLVRAVGGEIPERFGYAASTLAYISEALCAR